MYLVWIVKEISTVGLALDVSLGRVCLLESVSAIRSVILMSVVSTFSVFRAFSVALTVPVLLVSSA